MFQIDLERKYRIVPADAVALNGVYISRLNTAANDYSGKVCLLMPDGRAAMDSEGSRRFVYDSIQECKDDAEVLKEFSSKK